MDPATYQQTAAINIRTGRLSNDRGGTYDREERQLFHYLDPAALASGTAPAVPKPGPETYKKRLKRKRKREAQT